MMTVRQLVTAIQVELRDTEPSHLRAAELLLKGTALLGNVSQEIREADVAYARVLLSCLNTEGKANRARIVAETTPEYLRKREARDLHELLLELCRSLKVYLRVTTAEMQLT